MRAKAYETEFGAVLENERGLRLEILRINDGFGLGRFLFRGKPINEKPIPCVLCEDNIWENSKEPFSNTYYPGPKWSPQYQAERLKIVKDEGEEAVIALERKTCFNLSMKVSLRGEENSFLFEAELKPLKPIKHELFIPLPFPYPEFDFLQWPYETPITPPFEGVWTLYPEVSFSPFLFGKAKGVYIGLGYHLEQERLFEGKIQFAPALAPDFPLRIYFPSKKFGVYRWPWAISPGMGGLRADSYVLRFIFSLGESFHECASSYRRLCGYKPEVPEPPHSVEESLKALMRGYKETEAFVEVKPLEGRAYHMQIEFPKGAKPPSHGYGAYIPVGQNMHLGLQLYKFYRLFPEERWAKEHALDIARFFISCAKREGYRIPLLFDPKTGKFRTFTDRMTELGFIYSTTPQAVGALSLYKFAEGLEEEEGKDYSEWKEVALKVGEELAEKVLKTGRLAREYDAQGREGAFCPTPWQLLMMDYFAEKAGEPFAEARDKLELWNIETFIETFNFYGSSIDDGALSTPHPLNHDCFDAPMLSFYFLQRYLKTGDEEKLHLALDMANYYWLCTVPHQLHGFRRPTKGLNLEQDSYRMFNAPFHSFRFLAVLPKLSEVTGEPFYREFFDMLVRVQLHYQLPLEHPLPAFHIGLSPSPDQDAPVDHIGEPNVVFIVEFAPFFFDTMTHPWVSRRDERCESGDYGLWPSWWHGGSL